jgi:hypothetical protein
MLYWNGNKWDKIVKGVQNQTLTFCNNKPQWGPCPIVLSVPLVSTLSATSITSSSSLLRGQLIDSGNSTITERGFLLDTFIGFNNNIKHVVFSSGLGLLSKSINGLVANKKYYFRSYAINSQGTGYGVIDSFKTDTISQTPSTVQRPSITSAFWNTAFPNRAGYSYTGQGYTNDFFSYANLVQAMNEMDDYKLITYNKGQWDWKKVRVKKTTNDTILINMSSGYLSNTWSVPDTVVVDFANFIKESDTTNNKRELCAFLANISKETTGGWTTPIGGGQAGDYAQWGLVFVFESGHQKTNCTFSQYVDASNSSYPPTAGKCYHGRGPIQLSWNYNFGQFSEFLYGKKDTLLNTPDNVSESGVVAFKSAIWFWMIPQGAKPSCHQAMHDQWVATKTYSQTKMTKKGFAHTNNIINGGLECRISSSSSFTNKVTLRSELYKYYLGVYGFSTSQVSNEDIGNYTTKCWESNTNAMEDY